jgi:hypothetical protein
MQGKKKALWNLWYLHVQNDTYEKVFMWEMLMQISKHVEIFEDMNLGK